MVLISNVCEQFDTRSLQLVTYGTEPMPAQTLSQIQVALPSVRFKQTYGLSELGILPTKSREDGSLWMKIGGSGFEYKIKDDILWVRSEMAMLGYLNAESPFDEDGYFNTQDVVKTDGDYIQVLGRSSEIINVAGQKVYPAEVENVLIEMPNIAAATVGGVANPVTGMIVQATIQTITHEDLQALSNRVRAYCESRLEPYKVPMKIKIADGALHSDRFKKIRKSA